MTRALRCEGDCGRIGMVDPVTQNWVWVKATPAQLEGLDLAMCNDCYADLRARQRAKYMRDGRRLLANRRRGYGPPASGEDVFRGFREGDK